MVDLMGIDWVEKKVAQMALCSVGSLVVVWDELWVAMKVAEMADCWAESKAVPMADSMAVMTADQLVPLKVE